MRYAIGAFFIGITDLLLKGYIEKHESNLKDKELFHKKIIINKVYNKGMILNAFENHTQRITQISTLMGATLFAYYIRLLHKKKSFLKKVGMTCIIGGAISNIYDRLVHGHVVDYFSINVKWEKLKRIVFNLGDMFIFLGGFIIFVGELLPKKRSNME